MTPPTLPTLTVSPATATNSLTFDYGTFPNSINNAPRKIDLLFTLTVTHAPFADGLFLTNEALECEDNTFGVTFCQVAIAQLHVQEPKLGISKGVVATNNPNGIFIPPLTAGTPVGTPPNASCPRFTPLITSATLPGFISSDLHDVDAGDWVTFAIAVENTGGAPAYEIELRDIIPVSATDTPSCFEPNFLKSAMCITDGAGTPIPFTTTAGGHGSLIIKLLAPLAAQNIAIITFEAKLLDKDMFTSGCCENKAQLTDTRRPRTSSNLPR